MITKNLHAEMLKVVAVAVLAEARVELLAEEHGMGIFCDPLLSGMVLIASRVEY